ncbi:MAG: SCO family protein [Acidiferrobacterales bacterium]|nr:SCO family protein [Acidiferrobacterales bacterium]
MDYAPPTPGSYDLSNIGVAPDGRVLDSNGGETTLHQVFSGKLTLLSFMYSSCNDINGCPLSSYVFYKIKSAMEADEALSKQLQLVSLSFDPEVDTPEVMRLYADNFKYAGSAGSWHFLTTDSITELAPILIDYDQDVQRQFIVSDGEETVELSHLLKVFLIDESLTIRNIYSVSFLHADLLIADVKTLMLEGESDQPQMQLAGSTLSQPGDYKQGYESKSYTTKSLALESRLGVKADLFKLAQRKVNGLPELPVPENNPLTQKKIELGRKLFFDRRLSINDTFSCAMCHIPEQGFTSNEISTAVGVEGRSVRRNSPTLYNVGYLSTLFHDGREENLEQQVWSPLLARNEMANPSVGYVLKKIRSFADYDGLFEEAFDGEKVGMENLGQALASYQRTLIAADSPFDRWLYDNQPNAMSAEAKQGFELFDGKAGCSGCHLVQNNQALFSDNLLHNTGLGYKNSIQKNEIAKRITLAPGVFLDVDPEYIATVGEKKPSDVGQYEVTENPADRWKFRTPTLRNIALTAPYMHNGEFGTLREVLEFYNQGGVPHELQSPLIRPLGLAESELNAIEAFLNSLTSHDIDILVSDAFTAPIGDPGYQAQ